MLHPSRFSHFLWISAGRITSRCVVRGRATAKKVLRRCSKLTHFNLLLDLTHYLIRHEAKVSIVHSFVHFAGFANRLCSFKYFLERTISRFLSRFSLRTASLLVLLLQVYRTVNSQVSKIPKILILRRSLRELRPRFIYNCSLWDDLKSAWAPRLTWLSWKHEVRDCLSRLSNLNDSRFNGLSMFLQSTERLVLVSLRSYFRIICRLVCFSLV